MFVLEGSGKLEGRVTDKQGLPVSGARVTALQNSGDLPRFAYARTDDDGHYRLNGVTPARLRNVFVRAPGYALWESGKNKSDRRPKGISNVDVDTLRLDVVLEHGGTIAGRVVELGTENPIPGVRISLMTSMVTIYGDIEAYTDASGHFVLRDLTRGEGLLFARKPGWVDVREFEDIDETVGGGGEFEREVNLEVDTPLLDCTIEMASAPILSGRVVDSHGNGIGGARLVMQPLTLGDTTSEADGRFRLALEVPTFNGAVVATARGYAPARVTGVRLPHPDGDDHELVVRLDRGTSLKGQIVDQDGHAVVSAAVTLTMTRAIDENDPGRVYVVLSERRTTSRDGAFAFTAIPVGSVELRVSHPDYGRIDPMAVELIGDEATEVKLVLQTGASIRGRLVDPAGKPVSGWTVFYAPVDPTIEMEKAWKRYDVDHASTVVTRHDGEFTLRGLPEGSYSIMARGKSRGELTAGVRAATGSTNVRLITGSAPRLSGIVLVDGVPMSEVTVRVSPSRRAGGERATAANEDFGAFSIRGRSEEPILTKEDGSFEFFELVEGERYDVEAVVELQFERGTNARPARRMGVLFPSTDLRLELIPGLTIRGSLVLPAGMDASEWQVLAFRGLDDVGRRRVVGSAKVANGRFEIVGLEEGEVMIRAGNDDGFESEGSTVRAGATDVVIEIP